MKLLFSSLFQAVGIVSVGLFVRNRQGPAMFDPFFFIQFACLSMVLVGPILTKIQRRSQAPVSVQIRQAVARACGYMSLILLVSILSFNLMPWRGAWSLPQWTTVVDAALLSLTATTVMAAVMGLLLWRLPAAVAKWFFRGFLLCGLLLYRNGAGQWSSYTIETVLPYGLSTVALTLAAVLALVSAGLLRLLVRDPAPSPLPAAGNKI
jgi:hypothetical protein